MAARPRLTRHQRETLRRIEGLARSHGGWAPGGYVGTRGACAHLADKGYIVAEQVLGPRGGIAGYRYRPVRDDEREAS